MVDFLFLEDPPIDPDSWEKAIARDEVAPLILRAASSYLTCGGRVTNARGDGADR